MTLFVPEPRAIHIPVPLASLPQATAVHVVVNKADPDVEAIQVIPSVLWAIVLFAPEASCPPATKIVPFHVTQFAPPVKILDPFALAVHVLEL